MKILLSGGGTMGSVSPLIAVYERISKKLPQTQFLFLGTYSGPEKKAVEGYNIDFKAISSGRLRRFFSFRNLVDPFKVFWGFWQSLFLIIRFKPNAVIIAGAFVGVPVAWAARIMGVPILIHQQDIIPGLANKLMANIATRITVSFEVSLGDFFENKTVLTGNPVREEFFSCKREDSLKIFDLKNDLPVLLVLGGGTGATAINELVRTSLAGLTQFCQVIHIAGRGKGFDLQADGYHQYEFLANEMQEALCAADLVVSRSGLSILSELVVLAKPTILIPIPQSHQEANAQYFQKNNAVMTLSQDTLTNEMFVDIVKEVFGSANKRSNLSRNIFKMMGSDGAEKVANELLEIAK